MRKREDEPSLDAARDIRKKLERGDRQGRAARSAKRADRTHAALGFASYARNLPKGNKKKGKKKKTREIQEQLRLGPRGSTQISSALTCLRSLRPPQYARLRDMPHSLSAFTQKLKYTVFSFKSNNGRSIRRGNQRFQITLKKKALVLTL